MARSRCVGGSTVFGLFGPARSRRGDTGGHGSTRARVREGSTPTGSGSHRSEVSYLTELRAALDAVYDAAGRPRPNYTDADVTAGVSVVKAAHVTELREAVEVVASPSPSLDSNNRDNPHIFRDTVARIMNTGNLTYRALTA